MVAFAPANDPQVAVAVLIERSSASRADITGGGLAGPIARDVMEAVIGHETRHADREGASAMRDR